jgi:hypothetical protein
MMSEIDPAVADIFAQMETTAMLLAYIHRIEGRDGLVRLLDGWPKASLINAADELAEMEMPLVAEGLPTTLRSQRIHSRSIPPTGATGIAVPMVTSPAF